MAAFELVRTNYYFSVPLIVVLQGWVIANKDVKRESYTVEKLTPNTTYMFLVRAVNEFGVGFPSKVSNPVLTLGKLCLYIVSMYKATCYLLQLETIPPLLSTGWFHEQIQVLFHMQKVFFNNNKSVQTNLATPLTGKRKKVLSTTLAIKIVC